MPLYNQEGCETFPISHVINSNSKLALAHKQFSIWLQHVNGIIRMKVLIALLICTAHTRDSGIICEEKFSMLWKICCQHCLTNSASERL